jgi:hypothetical protein
MSYHNRITTLTETHRLLDKQIIEAEKNPNFSQEKIAEMKKQKLKYKDEINRLTKLQWEQDHEHLDYGDDR